MKKTYNRQLDVIRLVSCIAVLFYHLNIVKGGYLAVCTFFVLSGYLGVVSSFRKEKFSLKEYYSSRIKKIYIPLLVVTLLSVAIISLISNNDWINLKPEVTSILFGYNNFWQLNANLDYFVRNVSTPFMHFWYISLLLQFELIFPLIFLFLKKVGEKLNKSISCLILFIISEISSFLLIHYMLDNQIMQAYYGTLSRLFSLTFGMLVGFIHIYYKPLIIKNKKTRRITFYLYLISLIILCFIIDSKSIIWNIISMFLSTWISMRLIDYAITYQEVKKKDTNKMISWISQISYEIYLVQYPVIFIMHEYKMNDIVKTIIIILITIILSSSIHFSLKKQKSTIKKSIQIVLLIPIISFSIFGFYTYLKAKDYTKDMNKLKADLAENKSLIEQKQKEHIQKQKEEEKEWEEYLKSSEVNEKDLEEKVRNLNVIGIGDSIMELAIKKLYQEFPNGYFDAAVNRTEKNAIGVIKELKAKGIDSDVYILNVGTNGLCNENCKEELLDAIGKDKYIFWLNATSPDYESFNTTLNAVAAKHDNVFIIDWRSYGLAHPEYLIYDKVHPTVTGCGIYAEKIYEGVYNQYLKIANEIRDKKIKEHEENEKNTITFIGNDLLRGLYDSIDNYYKNSKILIDDYNKKDLNKLLEDDSLSNHIVLVFDNNFYITKKEFQEIIDSHKDKTIHLITTNKKIKGNHTNIIYYNAENNTSLDNIHLTKKGNEELFEKIKDKIK